MTALLIGLIAAAIALAAGLRFADRAIAGTQGMIDTIAYAAQDPASGWFDAAAYDARVERELSWAQRHRLPLTVVVVRWYGRDHGSPHRVTELAAVHRPGSFVVELGAREVALVYPGVALEDTRMLVSAASRLWSTSAVRSFDLGLAVAPDDGVDARVLLAHARATSEAWQDLDAAESGNGVRRPLAV